MEYELKVYRIDDGTKEVMQLMKNEKLLHSDIEYLYKFISNLMNDYDFKETINIVGGNSKMKFEILQQGEIIETQIREFRLFAVDQVLDSIYNDEHGVVEDGSPGTLFADMVDKSLRERNGKENNLTVKGEIK